jgi:hypothetical protein
VSGLSNIKNFKSQMPNIKWFDKLTTTLSQVEGQITMTEIQNPKQLGFNLIWNLNIGIYLAQFYDQVVLRICYFRIIR